MFDRSQLHRGESVFDRDGNKVGDIGDIGADHFDVSAGFLGFQHLYVPFGEISRIENNQVYLSMPKDQIGKKGWENQPGEYAGTGQTSMYGTAAAGTVYPEAHKRALPSSFVGYSIHSSDDKDIGKVSEEGQGYVQIQQGVFGLGGELWIPNDCIDRCSSDQQRCYLSIPQSQINTMGWGQGPEQSLAAGCGEMRQQADYRTGNTMDQDYDDGAEPQGTRTIPLREEELIPKVSRQRVGEVDVTTGIEEQRQTIQVPVTHDEVTITQRPVNRPSDQGPTGQGEIRVPVYEEQVNLEKQRRVYGEVEVSEKTVTEQQNVSGTVRKEVPHVRQQGNVQGNVNTSGIEKPRSEGDKT